MQVLKEVLGAIKDIKAQSANVELRYIELLDRFATRVSSCKPELLQQYRAEYTKCAQLQEMWNKLEAESVQINAGLEDVKQEFSSITCQQVQKFQERVAQFYQEFKSSGPGRGNIDLAVGVKLMKETEAALGEILKERDALVLAQKLFELDITAYPELSKVFLNPCSHSAEALCVASDDSCIDLCSIHTLQKHPCPLCRWKQRCRSFSRFTRCTKVTQRM